MYFLKPSGRTRTRFVRLSPTTITSLTLSLLPCLFRLFTRLLEGLLLLRIVLVLEVVDGHVLEGVLAKPRRREEEQSGAASSSVHRQGRQAENNY